YHPNARGFEEFYGFCSGHWGNYFSPLLDHNGDIVRGNGYLTDDLTDRAMRHIERRRGEPFFVYLAYNTPHSPMQVPDEWWDKFRDKPLTQPHRDQKREDVDHTRAALAMCENIDWNVGRLMAKLDELRLADNTIVVYFSDNGPNGRRWNGGMRGKKGSVDEGGVRSPLFVRWPARIAAGTEVMPICAAYDLLPTLADLCGVAVSGTKPLDGVSLRPLLTGDSAGLAPDGSASTDWAERTFVNFWRKLSVRTQRYRLDDAGKLYDMVADPGQRKPVNDAHPDIARRLTAHADAWRKEMLVDYGRKFDKRPLVIGHGGATLTQLPARDGKAVGKIKRSSRFANDSFFTNWTTSDDAITWECEVGEAGEYLVELFYTCSEENVGATLELAFNDARVAGRVAVAHDPPLIGAEHDRVKRGESYVKDFRRMRLGRIELEPGRGTLTLRALDIPGDQAIDLRTVLLKRVM
ncbi:MAG: sulfatase-like hydrolase/transferase, partial [Planctomycetota bacterium]